MPASDAVSPQPQPSENALHTVHCAGGRSASGPEINMGSKRARQKSSLQHAVSWDLWEEVLSPCSHSSKNMLTGLPSAWSLAFQGRCPGDQAITRLWQRGERGRLSRWAGDPLCLSSSPVNPSLWLQLA